MNYDDEQLLDDPDQELYHVVALRDPAKGRTVYAIKGPGLPYEPLLAGAFTAFENQLQAKTLARDFNAAHKLGADSIRKAFHELIRITP